MHPQMHVIVQVFPQPWQSISVSCHPYGANMRICNCIVNSVASAVEGQLCQFSQCLGLCIYVMNTVGKLLPPCASHISDERRLGVGIGFLDSYPLLLPAQQFRLLARFLSSLAVSLLRQMGCGGSEIYVSGTWSKDSCSARPSRTSTALESPTLAASSV